MQYQDLLPIARSEAEHEIASGERERVCLALVRLAFHEPERVFVESVLAQQLESPDPWIRGVSATCVGHLARIHRALDEKLVPLILKLGNHPETAGRMEDALDDIELFLGKRVRG